MSRPITNFNFHSQVNFEEDLEKHPESARHTLPGMILSQALLKNTDPSPIHDQPLPFEVAPSLKKTPESFEEALLKEEALQHPQIIHSSAKKANNFMKSTTKMYLSEEFFGQGEEETLDLDVLLLNDDLMVSDLCIQETKLQQGLESAIRDIDRRMEQLLG